MEKEQDHARCSWDDYEYLRYIKGPIGGRYIVKKHVRKWAVMRPVRYSLVNQRQRNGCQEPIEKAEQECWKKRIQCLILAKQ